MQSSPIFIVGVQRSGTTLLSAMLANHSRLSCGPETHFFHQLANQDPVAICNIDTWPDEAVKFLAGIAHKGYQGEPDKPLLEKYRLTQQEARERLEGKPSEVPSILAGITENHMELMGKSRWIEKTPDHIQYLEQLRQYFPGSPVIRIVRDPRDVSLSLSKVPWGVESFLQGLVVWSRLDEESSRFFKNDTNTYTIYYEKLVQSPEAELTNLCDFLGEKFEGAMLDTTSTGKYLNSQLVSWKAKASKPLDKSRIFSWKKQLSAGDNKLAESIIGDHLRDHGYQQNVTFDLYGSIFPAQSNILEYEGAFRKLALDGVRIWANSLGELPQVSIYLGDPGIGQWLRPGAANKVSDLVKFMGIISRDLLSRQRIIWVNNPAEPKWTGLSSQIVKIILSPFRFKSTQGTKPKSTNQNSSISN